MCVKAVHVFVDPETTGTHQTKNLKSLAWQQGLVGAQIGTLVSIMVSIRLKKKSPGMPVQASRCRI